MQLLVSSFACFLLQCYDEGVVTVGGLSSLPSLICCGVQPALVPRVVLAFLLAGRSLLLRSAAVLT